MNSGSNNTKLPCQDNCDAPLCPLECHEMAQWFADEDVCRSRAHWHIHWIKIQRKIKRLLVNGRIPGDETCFTLPMLKAMKSVRRPKGIRPEDLYRNGTGQARQNT